MNFESINGITLAPPDIFCRIERSIIMLKKQKTVIY